VTQRVDTQGEASLEVRRQRLSGAASDDTVAHRNKSAPKMASLLGARPMLGFSANVATVDGLRVRCWQACAPRKRFRKADELCSCLPRRRRPRRLPAGSSA
jgi:hypothetical protein